MSKRWFSPAKLNLFLHITGQRKDGFHELQTVFQFLDYCDELTFDIHDDGLISLTQSLPDVDDKDNLIIKAAKKLQQRLPTKNKLGAIIGINKKLPMGGGLGGGSSNAATTLVALNELWNLNLTTNELMSIGLELGADVPVFIYGKACYAEGVGEICSEVEPEESIYLILVPNCHVNTGEIFSNPTLTRNSKTIRIRAPLTWEVLGGLNNDCEAVVTKSYPEVNQALIWLNQYGLARMTGTGACVFLVCKSQQEASNIVNQKPNGIPEGMKAFIAKGLNLSPLYGKRDSN